MTFILSWPNMPLPWWRREFDVVLRRRPYVFGTPSGRLIMRVRPWRPAVLLCWDRAPLDL